MLDSRLIATMGSSDSTSSRHFPAPSPKAPSMASVPFSRSVAVSVIAVPAGRESSTWVPGEAALSSVPVISTAAE